MIQEELSGKINGAVMDVLCHVERATSTLHPVIAAKPSFSELALSERSESNGRHL